MGLGVALDRIQAVLQQGSDDRDFAFQRLDLVRGGVSLRGGAENLGADPILVDDRHGTASWVHWPEAWMYSHLLMILRPSIYIGCKMSNIFRKIDIFGKIGTFRRFFGGFSAFSRRGAENRLFSPFSGNFRILCASIRSNLGKYRKSEPQSLTFRFLADLRDLTHPGVG
ncbi:MAG: hypothetical protein ACYSWO_30815 [Planctomycetota bacterium]|jgi:hypothetical protein